MELKTLTLDILSKILGKTPDSVAELLFKKSEDGQLTDEIADGAGATIATLHAEHLKTIEPEFSKDALDKIHKEAKFDAMSKKELAIKKKYNVDGKDLDEAIENAVRKAASNEDNVLTHPIYTSLVAKYDTDIEAVKSEAEARVLEVTTQAAKRERFSEKLPIIDAELTAAGVVMQAVTPKTKAAFLAEFSGLDFETNESGATYLKDANGKLVKDQFGHPITLQSFTQAKASEWFPIEIQPGRKAPGNDPSSPPAPVTWNKDNVPKTQDDFYRQFPTIPAEQKQAFMDAYTAASQ